MNDLPKELFLAIFKCISLSGDKRWFRILHVCRAWRRAAQDYSSLWTYIDVSHFPISRINATLTYSKSSPLVLFMQSYPCLARAYSETKEQMVRVLEERTRIEWLALIFDDTNDWKSWSSIIDFGGKGFPSLKRLKLSKGNMWQTFTLPERIHGSAVGSPLLSEISLAGFLVPSTYSLASNLRFIHLTFAAEELESEKDWNMDILLDFLSRAQTSKISAFFGVSE